MRLALPALIAALMLLPAAQLPTAEAAAGDGGGAPPAPMAGEAPYSDLGGDNAPVLFTNVSAQAGLDGHTGQYFAWGDYDNDGDQDLLVNGRKLLRNNGAPDWDFTDVSSEEGISGHSRINVGIWGDYDDDGDLDVYLAGGGWSESNPTRSDRLLRNEGAPDWNFTDVTVEAGNVVDDYPSVAAAWGDVDGDGDLDLYVANYENSDMTAYWPDTLWLNDGDGTFTDGSASSGIRSAPRAPGRGVAFCDFDNDGDADIHVSNYRLKANYLWQNDGAGHFTDVAAAKGVTGDANYYQGYGPYYGHTIGASWADWNNDGAMDLWEANLVHKYVGGSDMRGYICDDSKFYASSGAPDYGFEDARGQTTIPVKPVGGVGTYIGDELYDGIAWADYDADGDLDVFMPQVYDLDYAHSFLYRNNGDGSFTDVSDAVGARVWNTYGAAWADYDNDGDMDLVTGGKAPYGGGRTQIHLYSNSGSGNSWLRVTVEGSTSNRMGLGTRVAVTVGNTTMTRDIEGGTGSHAQMNDLPVEFGLGRATAADTVVVTFPSGIEMTLLDVAANRTVHVAEDPGASRPVLAANETLPFEDQEVNLSTTDGPAPGSSYQGFYWDLDGDNVFEHRTAGAHALVSWPLRGVKALRVAVPRLSGDLSYVSLSEPLEVDVRNALPVAVAGEDATIAEGEGLELDGSASWDTPSDLAALEFKWVVDGDDGGWGAAPNRTVGWTTHGSHTAVLYVRDDDGAVASDSMSIEVVNVAPVVEHPGDLTISEDEEVLIHATATDTPTDEWELFYRIHFGDGNMTGWLPEAKRWYLYRTAGVKQVRVDARDGDGAIGTVVFNITVVNALPTCRITLDQTEYEEDEAFRVGGVVSDTLSDRETLRWRFDLGDGSGTEWRRKPVEKVEHSYPLAGLYEVTLYVTDDDGDINSTSLTLNVTNRAPSAALTLEGDTFDEDELVRITAAVTDTASDLDLLEFSWDLGDGTVTEWAVNDTTVQHAYADQEVYTVTLRVRDDDGAEAAAEAQLRVNNVVPYARATQSAMTVLEDEAVTFNATESTDSWSDLASLTYSWAIGPLTLRGPVVSHSWAEAGSHTVVLTVTDDDGVQNDLYLVVVIENLAPTGSASVDRTEAGTGEPLTFLVTDLHDTPSDLANLTVTWLFADGTVEEGVNVTHVFDVAGDYLVTVRIRDDDGAAQELYVPVTVTRGEGELAGSAGLLAGAAVGVLVVLVVFLFIVRERRLRMNERPGPPEGMAVEPYPALDEDVSGPAGEAYEDEGLSEDAEDDLEGVD